MALFPPAYNRTHAVEGGVNYDPRDMGNVVVNGVVTTPTYRGIAPKYWPLWDGWKLIAGVVALMPPMPVYGSTRHSNWCRELNKRLDSLISLQQMVVDFFRANFWEKHRLGKIGNQQVAEWIYDHAVNAGGRGVMWAQLAARVKPDGDLGPVTLAAINASPPGQLLQRMADIAGAYRLDRGSKFSDQSPYLVGWLRRDGQPPAIIAMARNALADGVLTVAEATDIKTAMAETA